MERVGVRDCGWVGAEVSEVRLGSVADEASATALSCFLLAAGEVDRGPAGPPTRGVLGTPPDHFVTWALLLKTTSLVIKRPRLATITMTHIINGADNNIVSESKDRRPLEESSIVT